MAKRWSMVKHGSMAAGMAVLGLWTSLALAADAKIRGKVMDSSGSGIEAAEVTISDPSTGRGFKLKTGKDGGFFQRGVMPSTYKMVVHKEGYTDHIIEDIRVQAGLERSFEVKLKSVAERTSELRGTTSYGSGVDAFQKGDFETALSKAEEAIAKDSSDVRAWDMKAKALVSLKRFADAIPVLEQVAGMPGAPEDTRKTLAATTYNAGVLASNADKVDDAVAYWEKAIELGHDDPQVWNALGRVFLARQEFDKSMRAFENYLSKKPDATDAAEVQTLLGELKKLAASRK